MLILLSNDDGILAPGLAAMCRELKHLGDVHVVAPASGQSAAAHSITITHPLICENVNVGEFRGQSVEGSPADCVKLAIGTILPRKPELVVSGINNGENVGIHTIYSGTVAAAVEGALLGCPSIAVSLERSPEMDFGRAAKFALTVIRGILANQPQPGHLFNVNIPALKPGWPKGVRVARQSTLPFTDRFESRKDPGGRNYYWLAGAYDDLGAEAGTDFRAQREGYITVVPLKYDLTDDARLASLQSWQWPSLDPVA